MHFVASSKVNPEEIEAAVQSAPFDKMLGLYETYKHRLSQSVHINVLVEIVGIDRDVLSERIRPERTQRVINNALASIGRDAKSLGSDIVLFSLGYIPH